MKVLSDIIKNVNNLIVLGKQDRVVRNIVFDSKKAGPDSCFVAIKGTNADGHNYIADAIASGARTIVCNDYQDEVPADVTIVKAADTSHVLGLIASAFYNHPSKQINLIGVTGTNGKTTVATLLHETFTGLGFRCGLISTIKYTIGEKELEASHTTPDAVTVQKMLTEMVNEGCEYCFMEVSSHAIVQKRIVGLTFAGGIFTNITHDHLDYHSTFDDYLAAKKSFFTALPREAFALTSKDDRNGKVMVQSTRARVFTYSITTVADFHAKVIENTIDGLNLMIDGNTVWFKLTGMFNAKNILAVFASAILLGFDDREVLEVISSLDPVEGRFQLCRGEQGVTAVVDYAHTPDALRNVLETLRDVNRDEGCIITVVGAGGDRDSSKRPIMAGIAAELSDRVILTSDNPRSEPPEQIIEQMKSGLNHEGLKKSIAIADRKEAIRTAVMLAGSHDIILVAGKGHEKYQEISGVKYPFDDMAVVKECLQLNPLKN